MTDPFEIFRTEFSPALAGEEEFFAAWLVRDRDFLPRKFPRAVAILHPGTVEVPDGEIPFLAPNPHDDDLDDDQAGALDGILLEFSDPTERCTVALYGGFMDERQSEGLIGAGLSRLEGRLVYFLGSAKLSQSLVLPLRETIDLILPVSCIWPETRDWFVASLPDLAFTVVGCSNQIADRLLEEPLLNTSELT